VKGFRGDAFFKEGLGVTLLPSSPTLRQRLDARAAEMSEIGLTVRQISAVKPAIGVRNHGFRGQKGK
jgi:hypothetical protein